MLVPALLYKKEIEDYFTKHLYDYNMFLYNGYAHSNSLPKIESAENIYQFAIIDKDDTDNPLKGYFSYRIDLLTDCVYNFGLISFCEDEKKKSRRIGIDVYKELVKLYKTHHRIEWRVIGNNPVIRHYDSFCKRLKGNRVHLHDVVKDNNNNYQDEYLYEIIKDKSFTSFNADEKIENE